MFAFPSLKRRAHDIETVRSPMHRIPICPYIVPSPKRHRSNALLNHARTGSYLISVGPIESHFMGRRGAIRVLVQSQHPLFAVLHVT